MPADEPLDRDVRLLADMLRGTIVALAGSAAADLVERIRGLAHDRRLGRPGAEPALAACIEGLSPAEARCVTRALSILFDLTNIAEDRQRVRVLRERERQRFPAPPAESLPAAIAELADLGWPAAAVQAALDGLAIELVFTAHPSEAKRRSIRAKLRRMRQCLERLDGGDLLAREREAIVGALADELAVLWQTEFLRPTRPTVLDEVDRGLSIMPRLWEAVPAVYASLRHGLAARYPGTTFTIPPFLSFGSWMGGDRDGNPFVTADVTRETLLRLRTAAIDAHLAWCRRLHGQLTLSAAAGHGAAGLEGRIEEARRAWPDLGPALDAIAPHEIYRRWLRVIRHRLERSRDVGLDGPVPAGAYRPEEFRADAEALLAGLHADLAPGTETAAGQWLDLVRTFGLHMTSLDVRQDARAYESIMDELLAAAGQPAKAVGADHRRRRIVASIDATPPIATAGLSPLALDTLRLFDVLHAAVTRFGPESVGAAIVSLTRHPTDVLAVLWLWRGARRRAEARGEPAAPRDLAIVPLFEKIADLSASQDTLAAILDEPAYATHLAARGARQIVMLGYSDSTKDGGYLAACQGLQVAQGRLHAVAAARGVALTFFHGRGGSLGRGGGPAARGILSLPAETLDGSLRLTEQGEVLAERYDDVQIAVRHLEQVSWATLIASTARRQVPAAEWTALLSRLAERSFAVYRELVDQPGFIGYFADTTPIDDIETLPIGSRPSRRRGPDGARSLDDLRAIPWVFAWTQSRCMIPAWYGLGAALVEVKYDDRHAWQAIQDMYRQWPFFQATIDNAALALAKADMYIAQRYSELAADDDARRRIWQRIAAERDRTRQAILDTVGGGELLATTPWFQRSIESRNPSIDPLNLIQIEFLRRRRSGHGDDGGDLPRLCVQGIAAGMRTTG
ncbi:MAG: phosphoenolpyruvate carboxylase [Planctomycetes bacterium]|nr:phosphoenolpyruvate carboxylase [Planctomycetota bacterium]